MKQIEINPHADAKPPANVGLRDPRGFSLLELLAVIVIIATLVATATPLYRKHAQQTRYLDGQTKLLEVMDLEHRYYARALAYTDDFERLGLSGENAALSAHGHYRISAAACEDDLRGCIELTASSVRGTDAMLTLDSQGRRTPSSVW